MMFALGIFLMILPILFMFGVLWRKDGFKAVLFVLGVMTCLLAPMVAGIWIITQP